MLADGFSLEFESKSPQVSRTRLRILAFLSNAVIRIVSTRPPSSKFSRLFNNPLVIVPKVPITIDTFMFHSFFNSLARSRYLSFFSHSFRFILWSAETAISIILQFLLLLLFLASFSHLCLLMEFHWGLSDSKYPLVSRTFLGILADLSRFEGLDLTTDFQFFLAPLKACRDHFKLFLLLLKSNNTVLSCLPLINLSIKIFYIEPCDLHSLQ